MRRRFKAWAASAVAGVAALGAIQVAGPWLGFALCINAVSLGMAAILGLPGIVGLLILRVLLLGT